ncbi:cell division ATP-binding protein FtsE [Arcanobacterium hippocoleae]
MITFENVTKLYEKGALPALNDVSINIDRGEFTFLVGASGSGKSTMLSLISAEVRPTAGKVFVLGKNLNKVSARRVPLLRRQIGTVFQDFRLLPDANVSENIALAMQVIGRPKHHIKKELPYVLELVGLDGKEKRRMNELSGGEKQRVAIARAMINRPDLLLADEPTGNLDFQTALGIMKLLDRINRQGTTVVMATHDREIVNQMRKRVIELVDGRVVRDQERGVYGGTH